VTHRAKHAGALPRRSRGGRRPWQDWPTERLLDLRLCDLALSIEGTWLEPMVERVLAELAARKVRLRPHFWLSEEWFSPLGVPGVALPFYLAHPRLLRLERRQMLDVAGGTREECLKLLRHEVGHAVQHAYALHRRKRWRELFGNPSVPYPDSYRPNPASKRFVQHLPAWYGQSHPDEDFAETFAVWLRPRSDWRRRYDGWAALAKLEYVDALMAEIAGLPPRVTKRTRPHELGGLRKTLRQHYAAKLERYSIGFSDVYDRDLGRLFSAPSENGAGKTAAAFLRRHGREIRQIVSRWTRDYEFTLDQVLKEMTGRCRELKLEARGPERRLKLDFAILLTVHAVHSHGHRYWHTL